jgi:phosphinothricin acetyltransferase
MLDSESRWRLVRKLKNQPAPTATEPTIRPANPEDMPVVRDIYDYFIRNTVVTFDDEPLTVRDWTQKWEYLHKLGLPFLVMVSPNNDVIGFAYLAPWRQKAAYKSTAENSIYLRPAATGRRLGTRLLEELIQAGRAAGVKEIIAVIADRGAEASIRLHRKAGFADQGHLGKVGFKFGRWVGTFLMQKSL